MTEEEKEKRIYAEQTWFATTTGALNGLLVNGMKSIPCRYAVWVKLFSLGISVYAAFLVLQRSATAEHEFDKPENKVDELPGEKSESIAEWRAARRARVWQETRRNLRVVRHHIPFVLREWSGALFYLLLIVVSCFAVMCTSPQTGH